MTCVLTNLKEADFNDSKYEGCVYLSVANEFGIFPFNFFVKERMSSALPSTQIEKDCFPCRVTGSLSSAAIATFIFYSTATSAYYVKRPYVRAAVQSVGA
ncbi:hypothetical protein OSTOST_22672, partial [Ostertagia ostertagi]